MKKNILKFFAVLILVGGAAWYFLLRKKPTIQKGIPSNGGNSDNGSVTDSGLTAAERKAIRLMVDTINSNPSWVDSEKANAELKGRSLSDQIIYAAIWQLRDQTGQLSDSKTKDEYFNLYKS